MLGQLLSFDKMITPTIIKIIFWLGIVQSVGLGLITAISAFGAAAAASSEHSPLSVVFAMLGLFGGFLVFALSALITRVYCELLILAFRIYETLVQIRDRNAGPLPNAVGYQPPSMA
jgi:hypothetical protein